ncbi:MAG: hypothetical protein QOF10_2403 [Kribbellaceae bacterium]|nr:hypothetical protein [Kribbellaceae bacterium]
MTRALDLLGPHLRLLPDGGTGVRRNWILNVMRTRAASGSGAGPSRRLVGL